MYYKRTIKLLLFLLLASCSTTPEQEITREPIIHKKMENIDYRTQKYENTVLLLLPLSGVNEKVGKGILNACIMASETSDSRFSNNTEFIVIDTEDKGINKKHLSNSLKNRNLKAIIGPVFQREAKEYAILFPSIPIFTFSNDVSINSDHVFTCGLSPNEELKKIFADARAANMNSFLIMLPNGSVGDIILKCIQKELHIANIENREDIEVIRYDHISQQNATKCANSSGKQAVFAIEPIISPQNLRKGMAAFTLSPYALTDLEKWSGWVFAFAEGANLHEFIEKYRHKFKSNPSTLDIIGYDLVRALYKMLKQEGELDPTEEKYHGCMGKFIFVKNRGLRRQLTLFQPV